MELNVVLVIALVIMVVVFVQLRNVLGKRIGFEKPPFDPYSGPSKRPSEVGSVDDTPPSPNQSNPKNNDFSEIDEIAPEGSRLNDGLRAIRKIDPDFSPQSFVRGLQIAYEMIITAFAHGDREQLKELLSPDMFESFCAAIEQREKRSEKVQFTFVGISKVQFVSAEVRNRDAFLTMCIVSEIISVTYNEQGEQIDGDPGAITEIKDVWIFMRNSLSQDPNWKLVSTGDES